MAFTGVSHALPLLPPAKEGEVAARAEATGQLWRVRGEGRLRALKWEFKKDARKVRCVTCGTTAVITTRTGFSGLIKRWVALLCRAARVKTRKRVWETGGMKAMGKGSVEEYLWSGWPPDSLCAC
jgi:hypothetical protein